MSHTFYKVEIITRPTKFEELKQELAKIGVQGLTVYNVHGCGLSKGITQVYRNVKKDSDLHERIKIETVVCDVPYEKVVETAKKVLYTGKPGDGKIFVSQIHNVYKIRTNEEGRDALQNNY
ncbi:MAG: P-II family nitrogen regulator [Bacillaceae bacterium]